MALEPKNSPAAGNNGEAQRSANPPDLFTVGKEFHLKEYESLKQELAVLVEHSRKIEIYAVGGIAAFYAWFLKHDSNSTHLALFIPILVVVFGGFRSMSVLTRIEEIAVYLRGVEKLLALRNRGLIGWETHRIKRRRLKRFGPFVSSALLFWLVLFAVSVTAALYLHCRHI